MSQHRQAIRIIEKESGLDGLILRPLSAHLFDPTKPERENIVNRELLLAISGRSRKPQIELAEKIGVKDYPCPAGGCLLTDPIIALRLRDLFEFTPGYNMTDLNLLKTGRHFRVNPQLKIILGRNRAENELLSSFAGSDSVMLRPAGFRALGHCCAVKVTRNRK